jgi:hypothetical protein
MSPSARPKTTESKKKTTAPALVRDSANDSPRVSTSDIALKAFAYYCERGCQHGADVEDWLRAERELLGSTVASATKPARRRAAR